MGIALQERRQFHGRFGRAALGQQLRRQQGRKLPLRLQLQGLACCPQSNVIFLRVGRRLSHRALGFRQVRVLRSQALDNRQGVLAVGIAGQQAIELGKTLFQIGAFSREQSLQVWQCFFASPRIDQKAAQCLAGVIALRIQFMPELGRFQRTHLITLVEGDFRSTLCQPRIAGATSQFEIFGLRNCSSPPLAGDLCGDELIKQAGGEIDVGQRRCTSCAIRFTQGAASRHARDRRRRFRRASRRPGWGGSLARTSRARGGLGTACQ